ncbi:MAG TPA: HlyD family type I secretion periplasmic adaptor subunit [Acetobacteraceae bacterium]|nr:HlyD family type I secretion periplasmic adaptor subunit [Acetobacteraceae bacterium]
MPLLPRPSPKATSTAVARRDDPTLPAILEYQSPSTAIVNYPMPRSARGISWIISAMVVSCFAALAIIKVDKVVTTQGKVVSKAPTLVVQPLETSIVRAIEVREGDTVHAGDILARLDPTFAAADLGALTAQVSSLQAEVSRQQAEAEDKPFTYTGLDPNLALQAAIYAQRQSEYNYKLENYRQKADSLSAAIGRARSDITSYTSRLAYAKSLEQMRIELERMNVGSKINTLAAMDSRAEMQRNLDAAQETAAGGQRDLAALIAERNGYIQSWHADVAEKLSDSLSKLSDARESLRKAQLRRQLVELRADRDATVLTVSKVSVGSVLQAGQQLITLVPTDAPLEVEANIPGSEDGYVHLGDPVAIKFDTFPYTQYGMAHGIVRIVSPDSFTEQDEQRNPTGAVPIPTSAAVNGGVWYRSRITLDEIKLHNTPPGFRLVPGMPVTADVLVGKQTVLRYLLGRAMPMVSEAMREP